MAIILLDVHISFPYNLIFCNIIDNICCTSFGVFIRVGDALATIASSTTFTEPFETPREHKRLGWVHKKLAGTRSSDHVALLNAFQGWESAR